MKNKNIWLLPTKRPSRLYIRDFDQSLHATVDHLPMVDGSTNHNVYVTVDDKPVIGDWVIEFQPGDTEGEIHFISNEYVIAPDIQKKIVMTDDTKLINGGIQSATGVFLDWLTRNRDTEFIDVVKEYRDEYGNWYKYQEDFTFTQESTRYKLMVPDEEIPDTINAIVENLDGSKNEDHELTETEKAVIFAVKMERESILGLLEQKIIWYSGGDEMKSLNESVTDSHIVSVLTEIRDNFKTRK